MAAKDDDQNDDLLDLVSAMADRIGLTGRDREQYIHEHMTRSGYRMVPSYERGDDDGEDDDNEGGSFFPRGNRNQGRNPRDRRQARGRGNQRQSRGENWYDD